MMGNKILPFWKYTKRIYPFTKDIMEIQAEIIHAFQLNQIQTIQDAFWCIFALDSVKKLNLIDTNRVEKLILDNLKGFKFFNQEYKKDDLKTLFCALASLKILGRLKEYSNKTIDGFANSVLSYETNNGFVHCFDSSCPECGGKSNYESIFYGIATLILLDRKEKLNIEKYRKLLNVKVIKRNYDLIYCMLSKLLMGDKELIDEFYLNQLLELEDDTGGFKFSGNLPSISDSFWIITLYSGLNWFKNSRNLGRILEFIRSIYNKKDDSVSFYDMDLKDYCYATLTISIIYDDLTENIKAEILKQLYEKGLIFYKELNENYFVKEDIIDLIVKELQDKSWFHASIIDNQDHYNEFLRTLSRTKQILAEEIIKKIKKDNRLNLTEYATRIKSASVIEITKMMIEKKIIIGKIESVGRFLRKEQYIFRGYMPKKGLKRVGPKNSIPYFEVIEEREQFPIDEQEINEILKKMNKIPTDIYNKIFNMVSCDKVVAANLHLEEEYKSALEFINKSNTEIQNKFSKYKYLSKNYIREIEKNWSETLEKTRIELNKIRKELKLKIKDKEASLKALKDLEDFQDFVEKNLKGIKNSVENITNFFYKSIEEQTLEKNKKEIINTVDKIISEIEQLTPNLKTQVELLNKIVENAKLMENMEISGVKFEPLHKWLEREFLNKRTYSLKTLSEIKSKLFKRDELKDIIQNKKSEFDELIKNVETLIEKNISAKNFEAAAGILKDKTKEALKFMENTNKYILDFIKDTSNLIDKFDYVVDDVMDYWLNEIIVQMQNQVVNLKKDLEKKIVSQKELNLRDKINDQVEKNIAEFKAMVDDFKKSIDDLIEKEVNIDLIIKELENKFNYLKSMLTTYNQQFNKSLKSATSEFPNFTDTANVQVFKWNSFKNNMKDKIELIYSNLLDKIIIKTIILNQKFYPKGRVKLELLKEILNKKIGEIRKRIKDIITSGTADGEYFSDKDEVVIYTPERREIIDFEYKINKYLNKLNAQNKSINNFYLKSCKKRQMESATSEIFSEIKKIYAESNNYDSIIKNEVKNLQNDSVDIKIILETWKNFRSELQENLNTINNTLKKRLDLKELINDSIATFKIKINEFTKPIEQLIEKKELRKAKTLIETRTQNLINSIKEIDMSIAESVQKEDNKYYKMLVSDLIDNWKEKQELLYEQIIITKNTIEDKIKNILLSEKEKELEKLINSKIQEIKKIRETMEETIFPEISIDLKFAQKKLLNMIPVFQTAAKDSLKEINNFVKEVSEQSSMDFKRLAEIHINKFKKDLGSLKDLFEQSYQMLEDEIIIKNIENLKTAYGTVSIDLGLISSNLKVPKSHVKNRVVHLIASEKLGGIIDPATNEYKFSEFVSDEDRKSHILIEPDSFFKKLSKLLRKWQSVLAFIATTITIGSTLIPITHNVLLGVLIPTISIIAAFTFVFVKHYKEKKARIN
ncbi:MAG: hypothetical protein ACTSQO_03790 [Candidatus Helarchaeota archaeon]